MTKRASILREPVSWKMLTVMAIATALFAPPAFADKPSWAGGGKKAEKGERQESGARFGARETTLIRGYFGKEIGKGRCPPGLARKNNGCMPPGQARKWHLGQPLPRDVVLYDLPRKLVIDLGPPPSGYKYVQVAEDILLIAVGTSVVMDAVKDIGKVLQR